MKRILKLKSLVAFIVILQNLSCAAPQLHQRSDLPLLREVPIAQQDPAQLYGELFERVQTAPMLAAHSSGAEEVCKRVFDDSKTFVDVIPRYRPNKILADYRQIKPETDADLCRFVEHHFLPPPNIPSKSFPGEPIDDHIKRLWTFLKREPDEETRPAASLIPLHYSYVVPGGRFREIYYWDSYFSQLGLLADGKDELFKNMVKNFAYLLATMGRIPNGNRDYYRGRSQPPFFSHMVALWRSRFGDKSAVSFLPTLKREHAFWMEGSESLTTGQARARVVHLDGDGFLNRYLDDRAVPRPEAYIEDVVTAKKAPDRPADEVYRDLRAGAESGWDFSTRWFTVPYDQATIQTTALIPIDLNSLLYHLELTISDLSRVADDPLSSKHFADLADKRRKLIQRYLWDKKSGTFSDYNWRTRSPSSEMTVAMVAPLFVGLATEDQAKRVAIVLEKRFLKAGGLVTTLRASDEQWDFPNGWAPHQWMAYAGLNRYKHDVLAEQVRGRWLKLNLSL